MNPQEIPQKLCPNDRFRKEVSGGAKLIETNKNCYGVPQGAPLSDLLANAYLLDFDAAMAAYVQERQGHYRRYSDDILIIVPGDDRAGQASELFAEELIRQQGNQLEIKREKTKVVRFRLEDGRLSACALENSKNTQGLEYLGFRFDGNQIYIRNSTISNLQRKIRLACRHKAEELAQRYSSKSREFIIERHLDAFLQRFGRISEF